MKEEKIKYESFWVVIPALLLEDEKIPLRAKKLYSLISSLWRKEGYCWATNKFLAEQTEIPIGTIRKHLKLLERKKWIKCDIEQNNYRKIFSTMPDFYKKDKERCLKVDKGMSTATNKREQGGMSTLTNNQERRDVHAPEQKIPNNNSNNNNIDNNNDCKVSATQSVANQSLGKEINELIKKFEKINPSYERLFSNKTQRSAIERLLKKMGKQKLEQILDILPVVLGEEYAPRITTPFKLEEKLADLLVFLKQRSEKRPQMFTIKKPKKNEHSN